MTVWPDLDESGIGPLLQAVGVVVILAIFPILEFGVVTPFIATSLGATPDGVATLPGRTLAMTLGAVVEFSGFVAVYVLLTVAVTVVSIVGIWAVAIGGE